MIMTEVLILNPRRCKCRWHRFKTVYCHEAPALAQLLREMGYQARLRLA